MKFTFVIIIILLSIQSLAFCTLESTNSMSNKEYNSVPKKLMNAGPITESANSLFLNKSFIFNEFDFTSDLIIKQDDFGNFYILGMVNRGLYTINDILLQKWDVKGTKIWQTKWNYNEKEITSVNDLSVGPNSDIYIVGSIRDISLPVTGVCLISKLNAKGGVIWNQLYYKTDYGSSLSFNGVGIALDKTGNIVITGSVESSVGGVAKLPFIFIAKFTSQGKLLWESSTGDSFPFMIELRALSKDIIIDNEDNCYILGEYTPNTYLIKYSSNGTKLWQIKWLGNYNMHKFSSLDKNNSFYLIGDEAIGSFDNQGSLVDEVFLELSYMTFIDSFRNIYTVYSQYAINSNRVLQFHKWNLNGQQIEYDYSCELPTPTPVISDFIVINNTIYVVGRAGITKSDGYLAILTPNDPNSPLENQSSTNIPWLLIVIVFLLIFIVLVCYKILINNNSPPTIKSKFRDFDHANYTFPRPNDKNYFTDKNVDYRRNFCSNCGSNFLPGDVFCHICGKRLV